MAAEPERTCGQDSSTFTLFYNHARPHQNLDGLTPAQAWNGLRKTDLLQTPPRKTVLVQALDGLLVGYCTKR
jgi:hypothetical protein